MGMNIGVSGVSMGSGSSLYLLPQEMKRQGEPRGIERSLNRQASKTVPIMVFP